MVVAKETFNFIDKREGVTKDGEKYLSINVLSRDNRKFNFITKDMDLVNKISPLNIQKFSPIKLILDFERVFNREKRISYWTCNFLGIE